MDGARLRWIGATRGKRLLAVMNAIGSEWKAQWSTADVQVGFERASVSAPAPGACEMDWHEISGARGTVRLYCSGDTSGRLGALLAGTGIDDGLGIAYGIGRRSLAALAGALCGADSAKIDPPIGSSDAPRLARDGSFAVWLRIEDLVLGLVLDGGVCDALVPPEPPGQEALQPRLAAVAQESACFEVVLDLGRASVQQMLSLRAGEMIRTMVRIDAPLRAVTPQGREALRGPLTSMDGRRAIQKSRTQTTQEKTR
ncbi:FliM/FliN family flagellar motor switch protein [Arenimonas terrae]|uniref:FliM/FliN family flagellar motor switch protein n=1 Tax=Arenimonas terrae TaxID=2546226 RepID=A0A5C4RQ97_9GAMM|nr:FliM/FliN family flagellar motor switch protein [Arenimonas terrae]TNJ33228.1 FliM/FliN family flagellar motor switch protein [Arenimonas terrae]